MTTMMMIMMEWNRYIDHAVPLRPLHSVLRAAARLVLRVQKYDYISTAIQDDLHWLPVDWRIEFKTCALVYKCLLKVAPEYLLELMVTVAMDVGCRHLQSAVHGDLIIPASRTKTFGPRAFAIAGIMFRRTFMICLCHIVNSVLNWKHICIAK